MGCSELGRARSGTGTGRTALLAVLVAFGGSLWVDLLTAHGAAPGAEPAALPVLLGAGSRALVTLPLVLLGLRAAVTLGRRLSADTSVHVAVTALLGACGTGLGAVAAGLVVPGPPATAPTAVTALPVALLDALLVLPVSLLLAAALLGTGVPPRRARRVRDVRRVAAAAVVAVLLGGVPALTTSAEATTPTAAAPGDVCATAVRTVRY